MGYVGKVIGLEEIFVSFRVWLIIAGLLRPALRTRIQEQEWRHVFSTVVPMLFHNDFPFLWFDACFFLFCFLALILFGLLCREGLL